MLPNKFAPWELVYYYCRKWSSLGEFDLLLNNLREKVHVKMGQKTEAIIGIMDSQNVRWGNNRSFSSIDGNKW
ncbi:Transposase and inactivated derivatives [Bacteroides thetaiotaomicron]|jgi:transposase|nr:Transposase and inactivated derivatives [Bacteroides thetaiotaomicron]